jgi:hypothetical protein
MIVVYSPYASKRLTYTLNTIFKRWLQSDVEIHTDPKTVISHEAPCKLWYAMEQGPKSIPWVYNSGFLEHSDSRKCKVKLKGEGEDVQIFPGGGLLSFDVFAAVFFCISRYEEYDCSNTDEHGRFPANQSLAHRMGFLDIPIVDLWRNRLVATLIEEWRVDPFTRPIAKCVLTVDVDNASAYAYKGIVRSILGIGRALLRMDKTLVHRVKTLMLSQNDPYLTYDSQWAIARRHNVPLIHFVLCAGLSPHDRSLNPRNPDFQKLIVDMQEEATVGWHPSYSAFGHLAMLEKEHHQLSDILNNSVRISRQHYIRLQFPETYRHLIALGMSDDYSMGYPDRDGFRAGTSMSHTFFDLEANEETGLVVHPFCFLDTYYSERKGLSPENAMIEMKRYADLVFSHGGEFNLVWHHRTFSELQPKWKGWTRALDNLLQYVASK